MEERFYRRVRYGSIMRGDWNSYGMSKLDALNQKI